MKFHTIICPACGTPASPADAYFRVESILAPQFFLESDARRDDAALRQLERSGFKFIVSFQFLIDRADVTNRGTETMKAMVITNNPDDLNPYVNIRITRNDIIAYIVNRVYGSEMKKAVRAYLNDSGEDLEEERENELAEAIKGACFDEDFDIGLVRQYAGQLRAFDSCGLQALVRVNEIEGVSVVNRLYCRTGRNTYISMHPCCYSCGYEYPEGFGEAQIIPILMFGGQQSGKTSLITAMISNFININDNISDYTVTVYSPSNNTEKQIYDCNRAFYSNGYPPYKTNVGSYDQAPLASINVFYRDKSPERKIIKRITFPLIDIPGELVATRNEQTRLWYSPLDSSQGEPGRQVHEIARKAKYIIICLHPHMIKGGGGGAAYDRFFPVELLLKSYAALIGHSANVKRVYIALTQVDVLLEGQAAACREYDDFFEKYDSNRAASDFEKSFDIINKGTPATLERISDITEELIKSYPSGNSLVNTIKVSLQNFKVNDIKFVPIYPYGRAPLSLEDMLDTWNVESSVIKKALGEKIGRLTGLVSSGIDKIKLAREPDAAIVTNYERIKTGTLGASIDNEVLSISRGYSAFAERGAEIPKDITRMMKRISGSTNTTDIINDFYGDMIQSGEDYLSRESTDDELTALVYAELMELLKLSDLQMKLNAAIQLFTKENITKSSDTINRFARFPGHDFGFVGDFFALTEPKLVTLPLCQIIEDYRPAASGSKKPTKENQAL